MYKSIQLTDKEIELLSNIIGYYIRKKKDQPGFQINNAHIILRHLNGKLTHNNTNQIALWGK